MAQEEVLRMVAAARDQASGPLRKVENALHGLGKGGQQASKQLRDNFKTVHEQFNKVADTAKEAVAPAIDAIGVSSLSAVGAVAALVGGLKNFIDQGSDVAAFGRRVKLTTDTIRGLEGVADKFHVDPSAIRAGEETFTQAMYQIRRKRGEVYAHILAQRRDLATELSSTPETEEGNEKALKSFLRVLEDVKKVHGEATARAFSKEVFGTDAFVDLLQKGNLGLEEAVKLTLKLRGNMDTEAGEHWVSNWSDFKAAIEGIRNTVGNDLLPDLTELARQGQAFFAEHKAEIGRNIADSVREIGSAIRGVNTGVQAIGGWKVIFEGLIALKLVGLAANIIKVATALRAATAAFAATPVGLLAAAGFALYETVKPQPAGESTDDEKARRDREIAASGGARNQAEASARTRSSGVGGAASIIQGLRDRGLDAPHAAIMGGNIEQESGFDPTRPNVAEGGIGLIQWNKERRAALQTFAAQKHKLETDAGVQMDFLMKELNETPQGRQFLNAQSPEEMNRALHRHIRYGDNSEGRRLSNGLALLQQAERSKPGSLLAAAGKSGVMGNGGGGVVTGSASLTVDVKAPAGTSVRAAADGLFQSVEVNRGLSMPRASEQN
jgi:hypothetical protein